MKTPKPTPPLTPGPEQDEFWMRQALKLAQKAGDLGEVPVGAILIKNNQVISKAYNLREKLQSPLGHAELMALHRASEKLSSWRILDTTLYVTLEPCVMCAGALVQGRVQRVVFGAFDPKAGALHSLYQIGSDPRLNHRIDFTGGVLGEECGQILSAFFKERRRQNKL